MTGDRVTEIKNRIELLREQDGNAVRKAFFEVDAVEALLAELEGARAKLANVEELAEKMANEHGQSWNTISSQRITLALHPNQEGKHEHVWRRHQNVTSNGFKLPPYEVCDGCDAAREVKVDYR